MVTTRASIAFLLALAASFAARAENDTITLDGITFSAEHGGLRLIDGWGRGTPDEPFVLVEEITDDGSAILTIRNLRNWAGGTKLIGTGAGFILRKLVTNRTLRPWTSFEMELREYVELPSAYYDGLSFGQAKDRDRYVVSDRFSEVELHDEPTDHLVFFGSTIAPGETVGVQIAVTDHSPTSTFYLIQRRDAPLAELRAR